MSTKIKISGLSKETTEDSLKEFFANKADVSDIKIVKDDRNNRSKGVAFVEIESAEEAVKSLSSLSGKELDGRKVRLAQVRRRKNRRYR